MSKIVSLLIIAIVALVVFLIVRRLKTNKVFEALIPSINQYHSDLESLKKHYISHSQMEALFSGYADCYNSVRAIVNHVDHNNTEIGQKFITSYKNLRSDVPTFNKAFVQAEKVRCASLFANIDGHRLDNQQQTAIVTDEDHNLVLAGAGSGKTLTITGKVKYLYQQVGIRSEDILLIAFVRKTAEEMTTRINKMGIETEAVTFHKLGLSVISQSRGERPEVLDDNEFRAFLEDFFSNKVLDQPLIMKALIEYFAYYLHIPSDMEKFDSLGAAYEHERNSDFETLKSKYVFDTAERYAGDRRTLQGEFVKSLEEVSIANFLFLHGINYEYERHYPYACDDKFKKPYTPDFYLSDYDIYLEHFGINKEGRLPWLSEIEEKKYIANIKWKRAFHEQNHTKLIETYSWFNSDGELLKKLETLLVENGIKLKEPDYLDIFSKIYNDVGDKYFHEFIQLCSTFITLFKANGYGINDLDRLNYKSKEFDTDFHRERTQLFKAIIKPILADYQQWLNDKGKVDFSDMIISATDIINRGFAIHPYKYIIIDEFQDISISRYKLVKAIIEQTGAHLLCVGDDWQSIYRFSGSDLSMFTRFEKAFGVSEIMRIEKTYRNSQDLIDTAASFIMKNPAQLKKALKSDKRCERPVNFYVYQDKPYSAICRAIDNIIKKYGESKTILLLGRTKYDRDVLLDSTMFSIRRHNGQEKLAYRNNTKADISFLTVHKAKGLEADNVIILNFNNSLLGFPNKIADDPILELVLSSSDTFLYAEERRLLYVALTRTRNEVVLITGNIHPSEFMHDFEDDSNIAIKNIDLNNDIELIPCPKCKTGKLLIRINEKRGTNFVGCSNYPQCTYTVNDASVLTKPLKCKCGGFMVKRHGTYGDFYGCTNYPTCQNTMDLDGTFHNNKGLPPLSKISPHFQK